MNKNTKSAFTMIELIFVIVVLGILSAVAIPKFAASRVDAQISKGRSDISSIRSGIISDRQTKLIRGVNQFIAAGTASGQMDYDASGGSSLFGGVLSYPVVDKTTNGNWHIVSRVATGASAVYSFKIKDISVPFTYTRSNGTFSCNRVVTTTGPLCAQLTD